MTRQIKRGDGFIESRTTSTGEPRFQARWHDGTRWRAKTFRTREDAEDHLRDIGRAKRRREFVPDEEYTFLDVVDDYLERGQSRWRASTIRSYSTIRDAHIASHRVGGSLVGHLTPRLMQHWIDELAVTLSTARVEVIRAVGSGALREAVRLGVIPRNPLAGVRMPGKAHRSWVAWPRSDVTVVLDAAQADPLMYPYYVIALSTGMRPGEILALSWADIDSDRGILTCRRTLTRDAVRGVIVGSTTKTGRARVIALPDIALTTLHAHRRAQTERRLAHPNWHDAGLVFESGNGCPIHSQTIWRAHRTIITATGVPPCRLHDLRHCAATLLLESGIDIKTISEMLGHASVSITMDLYAHVTPVMQRRAADTMGDILGSGSA